MNPLSHVPRPSTTLTPRWRQAFWKARTPRSSVRTTTTDWSRISYSTKSSGSRDLLEPARHLPDPGPEQLGLHLVEVRVEVALLAGPVGELHGVGHRECRPFPIHDRHAGPLSSRRAFRRSVYSPSTGRYKFCAGTQERRTCTPVATMRLPDGLIAAEAHDIPRTRTGPELGPAGRRRRRAGRRRRHHRHLPALPRPRGRLLRPAARGRRRRRGHLVLEPLPRGPVRLGELHLRLPVLEGAVRRVGVAGALRRAAGDRALPQPRGGPLRPPAPHAVRRHGSPRPSTTSRRGRGR